MEIVPLQNTIHKMRVLMPLLKAYNLQDIAPIIQEHLAQYHFLDFYYQPQLGLKIFTIVDHLMHKWEFYTRNKGFCFFYKETIFNHSYNIKKYTCRAIYLDKKKFRAYQKYGHRYYRNKSIIAITEFLKSFEPEEIKKLGL